MFVVGGVEVIDLALQAGIHNGQVLVGKRDIDDDIRSGTVDELYEFGDRVGIDLRRFDLHAGSLFDIHSDVVALAKCPARQCDLSESVDIHGALECHDVTDAACADDKGFFIGYHSCTPGKNE